MMFSGAFLALLNVFLVDVFVVEHLRKHAVASLRASLRVTVGGGIIIWRANDAGEVGTLGKAELTKVLAEIRPDAGLRESPDAEAAAVAEIDFVGIQLENLRLGEALLELNRHHGFGNFSPEGALIAQEKRARDLHGDGAGALEMIAGVAQIGPSSAPDAQEVEAAVLKKTFVFRGENGVYEKRWGNVYLELGGKGVSRFSYTPFSPRRTSGFSSMAASASCASPALLNPTCARASSHFQGAMQIARTL